MARSMGWVHGTGKEEREAWEEGGRRGPSVAVAHSRLQMVPRAAMARKRRRHKERIDES